VDQSTPRRTGQIISRKGNRLIVRPADESYSDSVITCSQRKKLPVLAVGDWITWEPTGEGEGVIVALDVRKCILSRPDPFNQRKKPIASNIDQIVIVTATQPGIDLLQVDRILVAAEAISIPTLLVINKTDLLSTEEQQILQQQLANYQTLTRALLWSSTVSDSGLDELRLQLSSQCSVLVGPSGAGKSSIIQQLLPDQDIAVGALSESSGHGRHTTSATTLYTLESGGTLIDSPGIREFGVWDLDETTLRNGFTEFYHYADACRFSNCRHMSEPGCAVSAAVETGEITQSRYENYQLLIERSEENRPWQ
jgi:ribosome biogenesis GTPase